MRRGVSSFMAALLSLCGAACVDDEHVHTDDAGVVDAGDVSSDDAARVAACPPLSPGTLSLPTVEATAGYDDALLSTDLGTLPEQVDIVGSSAFSLLMLRYMLEGADADVVDVAAAKEASLLSWAAVASLRDEGTDADVTLLRRGLFRFYACERAFPTTLLGFKAEVHDFSTDEAQETVDSRVKGLPRRIYRNAETGTFVAETLEGGVVRETEIILTDRRRDGRIDFLEYDHEGQLVGASRFRGSNGQDSVAAVPFGCITCHGTDVVSPASP